MIYSLFLLALMATVHAVPVIIEPST
jgi:hypothetical protein